MYQCSKAFYMIARRMTDLETITLPNLMAEERIYPDYICYGNLEAKYGEMEEHLSHWLSDPQHLEETRGKLKLLHDQVGQPGASSRCAAFIVKTLDNDIESSDKAETKQEAHSKEQFLKEQLPEHHAA